MAGTVGGPARRAVFNFVPDTVSVASALLNAGVSPDAVAVTTDQCITDYVPAIAERLVAIVPE
jgi:hypothetical protein